MVLLHRSCWTERDVLDPVTIPIVGAREMDVVRETDEGLDEVQADPVEASREAIVNRFQFGELPIATKTRTPFTLIIWLNGELHSVVHQFLALHVQLPCWTRCPDNVICKLLEFVSQRFGGCQHCGVLPFHSIVATGEPLRPPSFPAIICLAVSIVETLLPVKVIMGVSIMEMNKQSHKRGSDPAFPRLLGDRLCLNYVNTIESPLGSQPVDFLRSYSDLVRWSRHVGILNDVETDGLEREGAQRPTQADATFRRALDVREMLTRVFRAIARGDEPENTDLHRLSAEYRASLSGAELVRNGDGYAWMWDADDGTMDHSIRAVVRSAVEALITDDLKRIKQCPGADDCGWLFYDTSKNASRRWCSMEGCGSRVKMRKQYARKRSMDVNR
jgi:predicted RNA-binding Zn ribbon-like protein